MKSLSLRSFYATDKHKQDRQDRREMPPSSIPGPWKANVLARLSQCSVLIFVSGSAPTLKSQTLISIMAKWSSNVDRKN